ncbi:protein JOKA2-like isoform X2 [Diospyros lotus]|uniref:protein JOKA2-like isoform X2 n=1 Tax=Diospyros lotus TaxID=55363 RepID=UPI00225AC61B|nr:protein JOKA2-like isoform X2 [Diospyros lotus]
MESTIVIKVKYGEMLRRFNGHVNEAGQLNLSMEGLREKVLGLFNFAPDSDFTLSYIDEDGDVVTLVDEEDLCDVMRQSLNPLRITVKLNAEKGGRFYARSSGSSTPMRSPGVQHPSPNLNNSVSQILKSVPEPFRETISKLKVDLASKAASSAPGLTELVEYLSKFGHSFVNPNSEFHVATESSTEGAGMGASMTKEPEGSRDDRATNAKFEGTTFKTNEVNSNGVDNTLVKPASGPFNLNALPGDAVSDSKEVVKEFGEFQSHGKVGKPVWENIKAVVSSVLDGDNNKEYKKPGKGRNSFGPGASRGVPLASDPVVPCAHHGPRVHPFKRSYDHSEGLGSIFHRGVRCNGCRVHPITGPRFKSKVKENYDLCSICFAEMGNVADYICIERPVSRHPFPPFKGAYDPHPGFRPPTVQPVLRGCMMKPFRPKLDSRFILDVNVLDGTVMASSTPFRKIWRMRNNGNISWPQGTQLVWIGGDKLSAILSVELQIYGDGLPVENELDVAVDFIAPALPGRYVSYWKMASPTGQKFGQRVWVLIQVEASPIDSLPNRFQGLNLNLPPIGSSAPVPGIINGNFESMMVNGRIPVPGSINVNFEPMGGDGRRVPGPEPPLVEEHPTKDQELGFPINDTVLVGDGFSNIVPPEAPPSGSYTLTDWSEAPASTSRVSTFPDVLASSAQGASGDKDVEQTLLKELEDMGFKQVDLNKEILRMNEYDLEQSVDELCGVAEWDPILVELKEMGFHDKEMNKKLLKKNNGSIKRVVLDLINGEKA